MSQLKREASQESLNRQSSQYELREKLLAAEGSAMVHPSLQELSISKEYFNTSKQNIHKRVQANQSAAQPRATSLPRIQSSRRIESQANMNRSLETVPDGPVPNVLAHSTKQIGPN